MPESTTIEPTTGHWKRTTAICFVLFIVTAVVFWPACENDFLDWDDNSYVFREPKVLNGISWNGLKWATTAGIVGHWHPLTILSLQLDAQLFGTGPRGFHRTAVVLHAANAVLAFLAFFALTGCRVKSAIIAAFFALHPMRVESVAWISERKDLLSGFFFWLTLLSYARYAKVPSIGRFAMTIAFFAFGLCSKSMLVTTPCVLLLLDYWPLARLRKSPTERTSELWKLILEKLPFFVLSAAVSFVTVRYQQTAMSNLAILPLTTRLKNAVAGYASYVLQTFWPSGLSPFYAIHEIPDLHSYVELFLLFALTCLAVLQRKRRPYLLVGWFWFLGTLVPVSGITQCGPQARADRYTYLAQIGLFVPIVWSSADWFEKSRASPTIFVGLLSLSLASCAWLTVDQISIWKDTESMWRQAHRLDPVDFLVIRQNLIKSLFHAGKKSEAIELINKSLSTADDSDMDKLVTLAMLQAVHGDHQGCVQTLTRALKSHPEKAELYSNRGKARAALGDWQAAVYDFRQAAQLSPRSASFQFYLAHAMGKIGEIDESRKIFDRALSQSPNWPQMAISEAWRKSTSSDARERVDFWPVCLAEQAIEATKGTRPQYLDTLAAAYAHAGRFDDAIATAKLAIQVANHAQQPNFAAIVRGRLELYENHQPFRESSRISSVPRQ